MPVTEKVVAKLMTSVPSPLFVYVPLPLLEAVVGAPFSTTGSLVSGVKFSASVQAVGEFSWPSDWASSVRRCEHGERVGGGRHEHDRADDERDQGGLGQQTERRRTAGPSGKGRRHPIAPPALPTVGSPAALAP